MNKKYDYLKIVSQFDPRQYKIYETIIDNLDDFCERVHLGIVRNKAGCHQVFQDTKSDFLRYLKEETDGLEVSRIESTVISFIDRNTKFVDFYKKHPICYSSVSSSMLRGWLNKTKTLDVNMTQLDMIYQNYIKFIHTQPGVDFLDNDIPYYDNQAEDVVKKLNQCKRKVIRKTGNSVVSNLICNVLWDEMFLSQGKINFKKCENKIWETFPQSKLPHTTLFTRLKSTYVNLLTNLLQDNLIDNYFDTTQLFMIEGKTVNVKTAIEEWLKKAKIDLFYEKKTTPRINQTKIVEAVEKFCQDRGIMYKEMTSNPEVLIACKCDLYYARHKSPKLYFYKNGVVKDFYNDITTSAKNALPKGYL